MIWQEWLSCYWRTTSWQLTNWQAVTCITMYNELYINMSSTCPNCILPGNLGRLALRFMSDMKEVVWDSRERIKLRASGVWWSPGLLLHWHSFWITSHLHSIRRCKSRLWAHFQPLGARTARAEKWRTRWRSKGRNGKKRRRDEVRAVNSYTTISWR